MIANPLVVVAWHDSFFENVMNDADDTRDDYLVLTAGYLIAETDKRVSVAHEVLPNDDGFRAVTHIQRSAVETITPLMELSEELRDGEPSRAPTDTPRIGPTSVA